MELQPLLTNFINEIIYTQGCPKKLEMSLKLFNQNKQIEPFDNEI